MCWKNRFRPLAAGRYRNRRREEPGSRRVTLKSAVAVIASVYPRNFCLPSPVGCSKIALAFGHNRKCVFLESRQQMGRTLKVLCSALCLIVLAGNFWTMRNCAKLIYFSGWRQV
jgi:hypothetical protein